MGLVTADLPQSELPFTMEEYATRLANVRRVMAARSIDILLVTSPENMFYLTGYQTTGYYVFQALLVPLSGTAHFVVRKLELSNVLGRSWVKEGTPVEDTGDIVAETAEQIRKLGGGTGRIAYEDRGYFLPIGVLDGLRARLPKTEFIASDNLVEQFRLIKSPAELTYIRRAAEYSARGIEAGIGAIAAGRTDNDVAAAVYEAMIRAGSEYMSSHPYIATGRRSALAHATYERSTIQPGDIIFFELCGCHRRYGGALMRTVSLGKPSPELQRAADASIAALDAIIASVKPGTTSGAIDRAGRSAVERVGLGAYWHHRTGYSIGLGFPPGWGEGHIMDLKPNDPRPIEVGMVFHVVPQLLVPGIGAVGFSETWAVTASGAELITNFPRELRVL
jgi:Xaa-Pro dipeptidase